MFFTLGVPRERLESLSKEFNAKAYKSHDDIIKENDLDLVSVFTPPSNHKDVTLDAIKPKINVICEKPLALNSKEAKEMVEEAQKKKPIHWSWLSK